MRVLLLLVGLIHAHLVFAAGKGDHVETAPTLQKNLPTKDLGEMKRQLDVAKRLSKVPTSRCSEHVCDFGLMALFSGGVVGCMPEDVRKAASWRQYVTDAPRDCRNFPWAYQLTRALNAVGLTTFFGGFAGSMAVTTNAAVMGSAGAAAIWPLFWTGVGGFGCNLVVGTVAPYVLPHCGYDFDAAKEAVINEVRARAETLDVETLDATLETLKNLKTDFLDLRDFVCETVQAVRDEKALKDGEPAVEEGKDEEDKKDSASIDSGNSMDWNSGKSSEV